METRPVVALPLPDNVLPNIPATTPPQILWVRPGQLRVDPTYQRDLSRRSVDLIFRVVADFDWRRFKPPVVIRGADVDYFDIVDGQHTAIAAATHGGIEQIPVLLIEAGGVVDKAKAFLGHNRDRVAMGATQMFWAAVAAEDETALTMKQVCDRAGATILRLPPPQGKFRPGDLMATGALKSLVNKRSAQKARQVIETCVKAGAAPISADLIRSVDELLHGQNYEGEIAADNLISTIMRAGEYHAKIFEIVAAKKLPVWRAMVIVFYQNTRKTRRAG